ncbi:MAG: hypothetical protein QF570_22835 [Myxococcota bacterium]|jgi:acetyl-CoA C-acetyltransferase|nr:hypothetical protein [Myxococcota bacterium]
MNIDPKRIPVLVGIGQSIERDAIISHLDLTARAAEAAFEDAPGIAGRIQRLSMVSAAFSRVGAAPASELAASLGLKDVVCEVTTPGGNSPQWLMNRACREIAQGELETTLLCGAEATRSMQLENPGGDFMFAGMQGREGDSAPPDPVVGAPVEDIMSRQEIEARLYRPPEIYPVLESALAHEAGATPQQWRDHIAAFMARSSEVAARNPLAWFQQARTAEEIATPGSKNRLTAEPYTKCMNSFAAVDLGAALLVTSLDTAREAGLDDQCIFPWAGATNAEVPPISRPHLGRSEALRTAAGAAFSATGLGLDDMDTIDIYSCFPVAVEVGAAEIGLALDDPRGLTMTGGMSFFGGPGNNYTSHGIACSALQLREKGRFAYVSGNGGILSKHSVGIYSSEPPTDGFQHPDTSTEQKAIDEAAILATSRADGTARVVGGTVVYDRNGVVTSAPVIATLDDGRRIVANADPELLPDLAGRSLVGETINVKGEAPPTYSF